MGFLNIFSKGDADVQRLPTGSLTVDRYGKIVTTTVSSSYPQGLLLAVAGEVLLLFREARAAQLPFAEFNVQFASLQITARELRGGAIIYLTRKDQYTSPPVNHSPL